MVESIEVSTVLPATPRQVYEAWLDSAEHSAFTGDEATIEPTVGGAFNAGSGYIQGTTLELEPDARIVQSWRTTDFPEGAEDSRLEVLLDEVPDGTRVTLLHTNIPDGQGEDYEQGWKEYYLEPMKRYFSEMAASG